MTPPTITARPSQRVASFDGSRGMMALLVMVWHAFLLLSPGIVFWMVAHRHSNAAWWWFAVDPSQFLTTAIVIFFILSGIVLTLPAMRSEFSWWAYYSSRLLRLYLPAWAALAFGALLIVLIPRGRAPAGTWLDLENATHIGIRDVLWQATLLTQSPTIDNPLWSISWEVIFSLFLPLFVLVAIKTTRIWLWVIAASIVISGIGIQVHILALMYMPTFLIGTVMAANLPKIAAIIDWLNHARFRTFWWWVILVASAIFIWGARFTDQFGLVKPFTIINHVLESTFALGFLGVIFIAMGNRTAVRFLTARIPQESGRMSYSLYLVHVPILATLGYVFLSNEWIAALIGLPLSILVAYLFSRGVEFPAHRLSKGIGRRVTQRVAARRAVAQLESERGEERLRA